jgi:hypothetical protein
MKREDYGKEAVGGTPETVSPLYQGNIKDLHILTIWFPSLEPRGSPYKGKGLDIRP